MGKLIKFIAWLLGIVLLLIVVAVIVLPMVLDPNDFKGQIVAQVEEHTGRTLQIDGDLGLSVFPWIAVDIGKFTLGNAEGFGEQPFAAANSAAIQVKLMPLLQRELEVATIGLDGLVLNLAKAKDGRTNWDDLMGGAVATISEDGGDEVAAAQGEGLNRLAIGGVDISDGRVIWDDQQSGQRFEIDQLNLKSGAIVPGSPVGLEMGLLLKSSAPKLAAKLDLEGTVELDDEATTLKIGDLKVVVDATGEAVPRGKLKAKLETALAMALDGSSLSIKGLRLSSGDLLLSGDVEGKNLAVAPAFSGAIKLAPINLRSWMASQGMSVPDTADPKALTQFSAGLSMQAEGDSTRFDRVSIVLDDTNINGSVGLTGGVIGFALKADAIDLDRYLAPEQEKSASAAKSGSSGASSSAGGDGELFPIETLRGLNLNGTITIGKVIINKLLAENVRVTLKGSNGRLNISQKVGSFYQGSYQGAVALNVRGKTPTMTIDSAMSGIQAGPLLKQLTDEERLTGKGRLNAKLNASGNSVEQIKRTLGGNLDFRFENGAVKGVNLAQVIRDAKALFKGESVAKSDKSEQQTDFSELSGSGVIKRGVLTNRDLLMKSPYMRVNGAGTVSMVSEQLDYDLGTTIVNSAVGQGGDELAELKGVLIPVHLSGSYLDPKYSIDWGKILVDSQKEELKEKLQDKLMDKLRGGKREEVTSTADTEAVATPKDGAGSGAEVAAPKEKLSAEDELKQKLKDKLKGFKF